ncbi:MAG: SUMF1/EgtB/PvdO family nonheme iron enzyme [Nitrospinae bacterium]|nr:SUMF1/EgtB/PvdO family nonheme iron enzyme [Nitrospinota bacterium]
MVFIKGGCYQMGDTFGDGEGDEKPVHEVCVDDFYMGETEVTQRQWTKIMGSNPSRFKGCDNCPLVWAS